ncbi:hypothetical protein CA54_16680 [Symmachiella macrocystis]|uniref:Uncharacterized protein n=1 Tax=Symmachiella macrocystis TaxID=2527985 RepID=A0A5C6BM41_9PLAN|nr:hypothetical protein [Symmachiella macrocystis]TWU12842.1 hypothetical protein CA54_16680 [Symmachiella macrocystis]
MACNGQGALLLIRGGRLFESGGGTVAGEYANVEEILHHVHVGDTRAPLLVRLYPEKGGTPIDLSGLTVEFYMVNSAGVAVVEQSDTGVTVTDAENGLVSKEFIAADVDTAGRFFGYFVAIDGEGKEETFPVDGRRLVVKVYAD